jgi:hypothetical protein
MYKWQPFPDLININYGQLTVPGVHLGGGGGVVPLLVPVVPPVRLVLPGVFMVLR